MRSFQRRRRGLREAAQSALACVPVGVRATRGFPVPLQLEAPQVLNNQRMAYNVIQSGRDQPILSLFHVLGLGKDSEAVMFRRTKKELRQAFLRESRKLDPESPGATQKLEELKNAYRLLANDAFLAHYASHYSSSVDAQLHVLVEGGRHSANFNPEHLKFEFVNHAAAAAAASTFATDCPEVPGGDFTEAVALSEAPPTASSGAAESSGYGERSFGDFTQAFQSSTGYASPSAAPTHQASEGTKPTRGADVHFLLRVAFDEAALGCSKRIEYERDVGCRLCSGSGRQGQQSHAAGKRRSPRKCPQCLGRGMCHLPSATYHIEKRCGYCGGEGTVPAPRCTECRGTGIVRKFTEQLVVDVRPGTLPMAQRRIKGKGNDGVRGGPAGDLVVSVFVGEHRLFHRVGLDLHVMVPISLTTALLGGHISVRTLRGHAQVWVPPGAYNGQLLFVDGHGLHVDDGSTGKLAVHLIVVIPRGDRLTGRQRRALDELCTPTASASGVAHSSLREGTAEEPLMETAASLKEKYRHWFTT